MAGEGGSFWSTIAVDTKVVSLVVAEVVAAAAEVRTVEADVAAAVVV